MATLNIEQELKKLWDQEQGEDRTRASLFNLIIYASKNDRLNIQSVVRKFPCRVLQIIHDETASEEYLRTSVSSETIGEGLFCEIIQIEVAGQLIERVPFMVLPQILPDLPVYLLWTQDPMHENAILPHLEPYADRIIFDSAACCDLQSYATIVSALARRFHCEIGDLNWSAIAGWRQIFAEVFGEFDAFINLVQSLVIRIHYVAPELEAAYLQAWIASRLNWKFQTMEVGDGNMRLTYRRPTNEVAIVLSPEEASELPPGTLLSVEIECEEEKRHYMFKRHPKTRQVYIQYSDKDRCDLPYSCHLSGAAEGQEIVDEIFYPSTGPHYREMLDVLTQIPWTRS